MIYLDDAYLDELEWRFNNHENPYLFRDTLVKLINADDLQGLSQIEMVVWRL